MDETKALLQEIFANNTEDLVFEDSEANKDAFIETLQDQLSSLQTHPEP